MTSFRAGRVGGNLDGPDLPRIVHDLLGAGPMHELRLFGGLTLTGPAAAAGGRVMQRRRLAVLAILAVAGPRGAGRDRLLGMLWPESDTDAARHLLADCVYVIRQALGADAVIGAGDALRLNAALVWSDVVAFEAALAAGDLDGAAGLYGGPLLDGVQLSGSPELEHWLDAERARLARRHAEALRALAVEREAGADPAGAVVWLRRLAAADPFDTAVAAHLVRALAAAGDPASALRHARLHELLLREELELEPGPELAAAVAEARASGASPGPAPALPAAAAEARLPGASLSPASAPPADAACTATGPDAAPRRYRLAGSGRTAAILLAAIFVILAGLAARGVFDRPPATALAGGAEAVAVLPFVARGTHTDPVLAAVHVLLATRIDGSRDLIALDPNAVAARMPEGPVSPERAAALAARLGARSIILGYAVLAGDRIELSASRYAVDSVGRRISSGTVAGPLADIFSLVDRLAGQLLVTETGIGAAAARTAALTTASLPALRHYLDGEAAYRAGRFEAAAAAYGEAIHEDNAFALAYQRLAVVQEWGASGDRGRAAAEQALRHAVRLPPRARYLVEAHAARARGDFAAAEQLYRALLQRYPDDAEGWNGLGETLFHGNPDRGRTSYEARAPFERARALGLPAGGEPLFHLISIAAAEERTAALDSLVAEYVQLRPDGWLAVMAMTQRAVLLDDSAGLARLAEQLRSGTPAEAQFTVLLAALGTTRLAAATRLLDQLADVSHPAEARLTAHLLRIQLTAGRWRHAEAAEAATALRSLDAAAAVETTARLLSLPFVPAAPDQLRDAEVALRTLPWDSARHELRLYLGGLLQQRLGRAEAALDYARVLERRTGARAHARAAVIRALVERRAGRLLEALQRLDPALAPAGGPDFRLLRGQLLLELGSPQDAVGWLFAAAADDEALLFLAEIEARLAQAYRALGRSTEANWHLNRFTRIRTEL
jgi:DNA-binding SARP family transcriptional activator